MADERYFFLLKHLNESMFVRIQWTKEEEGKLHKIFETKISCFTLAKRCCATVAWPDAKTGSIRIDLAFDLRVVKGSLLISLENGCTRWVDGAVSIGIKLAHRLDFTEMSNWVAAFWRWRSQRKRLHSLPVVLVILGFLSYVAVRAMQATTSTRQSYAILTKYCSIHMQ